MIEALRRFLDRAGSNAWLLLVITMVIWGANAPVIRAASGEISPMMIVHLRWALVAIAIWFFAPPAFREDWKLVRARPVYLIAMAAMMTASNAMIFTAANYTTAINLSILQGAGPVLLIIGARMARKTRITPARAFGVALSLADVVLLAAGGDLSALRSLTFNIGDLLMLASVALYCVYVLMLRQRAPVSAYSFFCFVALGSWALSLPLFIWEIAAGLAIWPTLKGFAALLYVGF
ncbi:MAG: DMT family transporter, partial [Alphaproteobacteria bacterium]|nr:DMT family transporter [Alphaproteobacteria bacterium]